METCPFCDFITLDYNSLEIHVEQVHEDRGIWNLGVNVVQLPLSIFDAGGMGKNNNVNLIKECGPGVKEALIKEKFNARCRPHSPLRVRYMHYFPPFEKSQYFMPIYRFDDDDLDRNYRAKNLQNATEDPDSVNEGRASKYSTQVVSEEFLLNLSKHKLASRRDVSLNNSSQKRLNDITVEDVRKSQEKDAKSTKITLNNTRRDAILRMTNNIELMSTHKQENLDEKLQEDSTYENNVIKPCLNKKTKSIMDQIQIDIWKEDTQKKQELTDVKKKTLEEKLQDIEDELYKTRTDLMEFDSNQGPTEYSCLGHRISEEALAAYKALTKKEDPILVKTKSLSHKSRRSAENDEAMASLSQKSVLRSQMRSNGSSTTTSYPASSTASMSSSQQQSFDNRSEEKSILFAPTQQNVDTPPSGISNNNNGKSDNGSGPNTPLTGSNINSMARSSLSRKSLSNRNEDSINNVPEKSTSKSTPSSSADKTQTSANVQNLPLSPKTVSKMDRQVALFGRLNDSTGMDLQCVDFVVQNTSNNNYLALSDRKNSNKGPSMSRLMQKEVSDPYSPMYDFDVSNDLLKTAVTRSQSLNRGYDSTSNSSLYKTNVFNLSSNPNLMKRAQMLSGGDKATGRILDTGAQYLPNIPKRLEKTSSKPYFVAVPDNVGNDGSDFYKTTKRSLSTTPASSAVFSKSSNFANSVFRQQANNNIGNRSNSTNRSSMY